MIGIEFIARTFGYSFTDLAKELEISPQSAASWAKLDDNGNPKKNISKKNLDKLSQMFDLPEEYFKKQLNKKEQLEVQLTYFNMKNKEEAFEHTELYEDPDTKEPFEVPITYYPYNDVIFQLEKEYEIEKLLSDIELLLYKEQTVEFEWMQPYKEIQQDLLTVIKRGRETEIDLIKIVLELLTIGFGTTKTEGRNGYTRAFTNDLRTLMKKYHIREGN